MHSCSKWCPPCHLGVFLIKAPPSRRNSIAVRGLLAESLITTGCPYEDNSQKKFCSGFKFFCAWACVRILPNVVCTASCINRLTFRGLSHNSFQSFRLNYNSTSCLSMLSLSGIKRRWTVISAFHYNSHYYMHIGIGAVLLWNFKSSCSFATAQKTYLLPQKILFRRTYIGTVILNLRTIWANQAKLKIKMWVEFVVVSTDREMSKVEFGRHAWNIANRQGIARSRKRDIDKL